MGKKVATGMSDDDARRRRVFSLEDIEKVAKVLRTFLKNSHAHCVLLVDKDGHLISKEGESTTYDMDTISSLVAGSYAAGKRMAKLIGEQEFAITFHRGNKENVQLFPAGERTLLAVLFDDKAPPALVRLYGNQIASKLGELIDGSGRRMPPE